MAFTAKVASARLSGPQVAMLRMAVGLLPCLLVPRYRRAALALPAPRSAPLPRLLRRAGGDALLHRHRAHQRRRGHAAQLHRADLERDLLDALHRRAIQRARADPAADRADRRLSRRSRARRARRHPRLRHDGSWSARCPRSASGVAVTAIRAARRSENSWSVYASFCLLGMLVSMPLAHRAVEDAARRRSGSAIARDGDLRHRRATADDVQPALGRRHDGRRDLAARRPRLHGPRRRSSSAITSRSIAAIGSALMHRRRGRRDVRDVAVEAGVAATEIVPES